MSYRESSKDSSSWSIKDFTNTMVCVKCQNNGLWMRAIVLKEINQHSVSVPFIFIQLNIFKC